MKIQAKNKKVCSTKLQVPFDGLITIDAEGIAEVSEKAADILVNGTNDWEYLKKKDKETPTEGKKADDKPSEDTVEDNPNETTEEETEEDAAEETNIIEGIKAMSLEEMVATAEEAGYAEKEWKKFSDKPKMMAAYLIKKYNESQKA